MADDLKIGVNAPFTNLINLEVLGSEDAPYDREDLLEYITQYDHVKNGDGVGIVDEDFTFLGMHGTNPFAQVINDVAGWVHRASGGLGQDVHPASAYARGAGASGFGTAPSGLVGSSDSGRPQLTGSGAGLTGGGFNTSPSGYTGNTGGNGFIGGFSGGLGNTAQRTVDNVLPKVNGLEGTVNGYLDRIAAGEQLSNNDMILMTHMQQQLAQFITMITGFLQSVHDMVKGIVSKYERI